MAEIDDIAYKHPRKTKHRQNIQEATLPMEEISARIKQHKKQAGAKQQQRQITIFFHIMQILSLSCHVLFLHPYPYIIAYQTSHTGTETNPQGRRKRHIGKPVQQCGHRCRHKKERQHKCNYFPSFHSDFFIYKYPQLFPTSQKRAAGFKPAHPLPTKTPHYLTTNFRIAVPWSVFTRAK